MKKRIITLNEVKRTNYCAVLELLLQSEGLSRVELAARLHCDNTTISRAVRELLDRKILINGRKSDQAHGRPRVALQINPDGPKMIGISLETDGITGVLTDLAGHPLCSEHMLFDNEPDRERFLHAVRLVMERLRKASGSGPAGVGVSVFGSYCGEDFVLKNAAALPQLNGVRLRPFLLECARQEVLICDHLVARANYLARQYCELNTGTVMLVSIGRGIGLLLSENGKALFCRANHGGEFGHSVYVPDGAACACGRSGCLETVASTPALLGIYRKRKQLGYVSWSMLAADYAAGDAEAAEILQPALKLLSIAIANQLNNTPVDRLVVTGSFLELGPKVFPLLERQIRERLFPLSSEPLLFNFLPVEGEDSFARGAALLAAREFALHL